MKNFLSINFIVLVLILGYSQTSFADCSSAPNGMGGNDVSCPAPIQNTVLNTVSIPANTTAGPDNVIIPEFGGIIVNGLTDTAVDTDAGDDTVTVNGTLISNNDDAINTSTGMDTVIIGPGANLFGFNTIVTGTENDFVQVDGGVINADAVSIFSGDGNDTMVFNGGTMSGSLTIITTGPDDDILIINGGEFIENNMAQGLIDTFSGSDDITISGGTFNENAISAFSEDDIIRVTNDLPDVGTLDCNAGTDTLIFSMQVPQAEVQALTTALANAGTVGSIMINGNPYNWNSCEIRIANFNGVTANIVLTPFTAQNPIETDHTVDAVVNSNVGPQVGVEVVFSVSSGPNAGADSGSEGTCSPNPDCTTDANGEVSWTYTSNGIPGTDEIIAFVDTQVLGMTTSNTVQKDWIVVRNVPSLSQWGLIAMAAVLGIAGYLVVRRRQAVV